MLIDPPPHLRRGEHIAYLLEAGTACPPIARSGVVVCSVLERYTVTRVARDDLPVNLGREHDVLVHRAGVGWAGLATVTAAEGGWIVAVAHALRDPERGGPPAPSMDDLLKAQTAAGLRLHYLDDAAAAVNRACEWPEPPAGDADLDAVCAALRAVEVQALRAHAGVELERRRTRAQLGRLDGAIVDREALLTDLGDFLFELRCKGAARRSAERAFVAAYEACAVDDDAAVLEACPFRSTAASTYLRSVLAWRRVRPLVARQLGVAATPKAA
jgi:hypothetical protein